jgi:hypothetical protein
MAYCHKYFDGTSWQPWGTYWENFGGNFRSPLSVVSWGTNRLNVFGITPDGTLKQKYEVATNWLVGRTELV